MAARHFPLVGYRRACFPSPAGSGPPRASPVIAVGTALAGGPPHRSQRALLTHWAPALGTNAKTHVGEGMRHAGGRQPSSREAVHALPTDPRALAAALKRLMPVPGHLGTKGSDRRPVAGHGVVGAVSPHHACQPPSLLGDGLIPASLELVLDLSQLVPHPPGDRDPPHPEPPVPPLPADMRETKEIKRRRLPKAPRPSTFGGVAAELDEPGLVGMQLQPELREPFAKVGEEPPCVGLPLKAHGEESRRRESHPPPLAEPDVNLSTHPAPIAQPSGRAPKPQCANSRGARRATSASHAMARRSRRRSRLNFRQAHRASCRLSRRRK